MSTQYDPTSPILIAENEALIALDIEDALRAAGFTTVGPFVTSAELAVYRGAGLGGAVVNAGILGTDPDSALATLAGGGVPVIVISGRDDVGGYASRAGTQSMMKPVHMPDLVARLRDAIAAGKPPPEAAALVPGTWVRILKGEHIGRRGLVIGEEGETRMIQVEIVMEGGVPVITLDLSALRAASQQTPRKPGLLG